MYLIQIFLLHLSSHQTLYTLE
jgi:hypothetical protein